MSTPSTPPTQELTMSLITGVSDPRTVIAS